MVVSSNTWFYIFLDFLEKWIWLFFFFLFFYSEEEPENSYHEKMEKIAQIFRIMRILRIVKLARHIIGLQTEFWISFCGILQFFDKSERVLLDCFSSKQTDWFKNLSMVNNAIQVRIYHGLAVIIICPMRSW